MHNQMFGKILFGAAVFAIGLPLNASKPLAQDLGRFEFMKSCESCHGVSGKGDGSLAGYLSIGLPDLTQLQKNNGGIFPFSRAYASIDGSLDIGPHGSREMPVWGARYKIRAEDDPEFSLEEASGYPQTRILALIDYLSRIQEK